MAQEDVYVHEPATAEEGEGLDDRQSWILVSVLALAGIVVPFIVYVWPPSFLGFKNAYLAAAMVPALLLGVAAIWSAKAVHAD